MLAIHQPDLVVLNKEAANICCKIRGISLRSIQTNARPEAIFLVKLKIKNIHFYLYFFTKYSNILRISNNILTKKLDRLKNQ